MSGLNDLIKGATGGGGGLDNILGGLTGGGGGLGKILGGLTGGGSAGLAGALLPMVGGLLTGGGLQKILSGLHANGLSSQADSWVGTGENQPISGSDVRKVVSPEELSRIASQLGVSEDEAADAVSQALPAVVDHVTPEGEVPPAAELEQKLGTLQQAGGGAATAA
jgi:uncharacterized protein YidB (DUF937 family)